MFIGFLSSKSRLDLSESKQRKFPTYSSKSYSVGTVKIYMMEKDAKPLGHQTEACM